MLFLNWIQLKMTQNWKDLRKVCGHLIHISLATSASALASKRLIWMVRWWDEGYLMYFFHSKLLFIPVLWKERGRRERRENGETSEEGQEERGVRKCWERLRAMVRDINHSNRTGKYWCIAEVCMKRDKDQWCFTRKYERKPLNIWESTDRYWDRQTNRL